MDVPVQKICCVCGLDASRVKRVKDPRGNYYCKSCYLVKLEEYHRRLAEQRCEPRAVPMGVDDSSVVQAPQPVVREASHTDTTPVRFDTPEPKSGWAGIMTWFSGRGDSREIADLAGVIASDEPSPQPQPVEVHRRLRRSSRREVRVSDLLSPEALAEAARAEPSRAVEPVVPVSPAVNPPVSAIVADYSRMVLPGVGNAFGGLARRAV